MPEKSFPFPIRRRRVCALLKKEGLDAILISDPLNVFYLTGFTGGDSWLFLSPERAVLISDPRYELQIAEEAPDIEPLIRRAPTTLFAAVRTLAAPSMKIGVESDSITLGEFDRLVRTVEAEWRPAAQLVERLREIKDKHEIAAIRDSVRIAAAAFEVIRLTLRPEMTEAQVRDELEYQMRRLGADHTAFPTIAAVGARSALPHAVPTRGARAGEGDLLLIDWGAKKNMYLSDLTRVLVTAPRPGALLKKIYKTVLDAQNAALEILGPGITGAEADAAARGVIERAGYGKMFNHGLGHGIGLFVHERGRLSAGADRPLRPGMVVTVEPGIYLPGRFGVRIEDDALITETGIEILSAGLRKEFDDVRVEF
ncbi:MAG: aminopeptidase P family protein [Thermoguttaceae bacterium]|nr:aminopeptidase P family protein [Thermoguttaceae bacterium]